jgi:hypothetical protein
MVINLQASRNREVDQDIFKTVKLFQFSRYNDESVIYILYDRVVLSI